MSKKKMSPNRRKFLKTAAAGGMATLVGGTRAMGATPPPAPRQTATAMILPEENDPSGIEVRTTDRPGADFMVDVIKSLDLEYISSNPGSSFRALQESIVTYGGNKSPEFLTCCHEESSVAMAHGYAKIEGKPMGVLAHATVGLQHAAMAIYNAYCDRVPVYLLLGNSIDATTRRPGAEWVHSVVDAAAMVRDYIKWDDLPISLGHFAESAVRGYKYAMTPPMMPVVIVLDHELQERPVPEHANLRIPRLTIPAPPQGDSGAVAEVARLLVEAQNPVIVAGRLARTPAGMARLIELAETLQAPVVNQWARMNFPNRHPLSSGSGSLAGADVILGLELNDYWGTVNSLRDQLHRTEQSKIRPDAKLISITTGDLYMQGNYQDMQRFQEVDLALAADAEATLPSLIEAVKVLLTDDRRRAFEERGRQLAERRQQSLASARQEATYAWDASPISTARLSAELWHQIKDEDWSLVSNPRTPSSWPTRLWDFDKYYQAIGGSGAAGQGYGAPAAVGAALANRKYGRLSVNVQCDGDLMYAPGVLWTAAHHKIPLLNVMHNNRAYHQEVMHLQRMANRHQRGITNAHIGTTIDNPNIDYAKMAQGMGVYGVGPIEDPKDLGPAIRHALNVVKSGEPAFVDVVTQPR